MHEARRKSLGLLDVSVPHLSVGVGVLAIEEAAVVRARAGARMPATLVCGPCTSALMAPDVRSASLMCRRAAPGACREFPVQA